MRREPHPISGAFYEELGDGRVRVDDKARGVWGIFKWDGTWVEGILTHADPQMLLYIGGPNLPPGKDVYWGMTPPVANETEETQAATQITTPGRDGERPRIVAKYTGDQGQKTDRGARSASHLDQDFFLSNDRRPELVPEAFRAQSPMSGGPQRVNTARFYEKRYHDLEVEKMWKRTWQMACREDDIPNVGDYLVYTIAHLSFLIVRTAEHTIKAHYNACLHRGRQLREHDGSGAKEFRCPYHGWSWRIDGSLKEMTTEWDFPGVREHVCQLPGAKVATWAGFVFINPDLEAGPLEEFLGPVMMGHFAKYKLENRYKQAHICRPMKANWKLVMEAFMEGYHVIATHPQMLLTGGDLADTHYDVFGNFGRGGHVGTSASSPQRGMFSTPEQALALYRATADANREYLRGLIGEEVEQFSDAELNDTTFNDLFPNLHPWGGWGRFVFRFRPDGDNPEACLMDIMMLAPWPTGKCKPPAAAIRYLGPDEPWTNAPALGSFARILDQDVFNLPKIQAGVKTRHPPHVWYSAYQEGKIRNFHRNYDRLMGL
jgi:phenylpropionate dioxygenase-like ring-hydroxylating dioxygenase large terminal subunit